MEGYSCSSAICTHTVRCPPKCHDKLWELPIYNLLLTSSMTQPRLGGFTCQLSKFIKQYKKIKNGTITHESPTAKLSPSIWQWRSSGNVYLTASAISYNIQSLSSRCLQIAFVPINPDKLIEPIIGKFWHDARCVCLLWGTYHIRKGYSSKQCIYANELLSTGSAAVSSSRFLPRATCATNARTNKSRARTATSSNGNVGNDKKLMKAIQTP